MRIAGQRWDVFLRHGVVSLSLVFCCYQQVYDIFNMSCLGVILQVRGCDGMSIPQNGAAAHSQSHVSRICQRGFLLPCLQFLSSPVSFSYGTVPASPCARAGLL